MPSHTSTAPAVPASTSDQPTRGAEVITRDGRSLPLVSARLHAQAAGGIARLVLEQRFENRYAETLHVTYRMPLPADGAVSGYAFTIAGRTIRGQVERKRAAREQFEQAIASGKTAALLEQDRADVFTQSIGNLPAGEALTVWIAVDQKLTWLPEGEWELRFPTVIGPRYVGSADTAEDARATSVRTRPEGVAARIQIAIQIADQLLAGKRPASPSHALTVGSDGLVELRDVAGAALDRDLVVRWPVAGAAVGLSLAVARPADAAPQADDTFGLVTIVPPARAARATAIARDLIVLLDTSGSMGGGPLDKAKQLVALLIESLGDDDRLELIEFSSEPTRYKPDPVRATRGEKQAAIRWLRAREASGGTEMRRAVIEAMRALRPGAQRQVVLATDGYIGGEAQIVEQLHRDLPRSCRLHFVGVGSSVNRTLATSVARAGRGVEVVCDLDEDAERAARRLIDRTRLPILTDVTLEGSALVAQAPAQLPDVHEGSPFVAAVQLRPGELVVRGQLASGPWERRVPVATCRPGAGNQAIAGLFGREHVADLEARGFGGDATDDEIERTGLAFQIATRFTSWIAIDQARVAKGPARHEVMPQALPYGTTAAAFGLRGAASDLDEEVAVASFEDVTGVERLSERSLMSAFEADLGDELEAEAGFEADEPTPVASSSYLAKPVVMGVAPPAALGRPRAARAAGIAGKQAPPPASRGDAPDRDEGGAADKKEAVARFEQGVVGGAPLDDDDDLDFDRASSSILRSREELEELARSSRRRARPSPAKLRTPDERSALIPVAPAPRPEAPAAGPKAIALAAREPRTAAARWRRLLAILALALALAALWWFLR